MQINTESYNYDYIIVGGGPTGMTLTWILSSNNKKVLLVEKEESLGGCHRVQRVDEFFSEHGPRIYSDSYLYFIDILNDMGLDFKELFSEYKINITNIDNQTIFSLSKTEKLSLWKAFLIMSFDINYGKNKSIKKFMIDHKFKPSSIDYVERLCRLTDGASADDYTLFQFLQLLNQQYFYKLFQPKKPNDKGLIKLWTDKLIENKVDILLNSEVVKILHQNQTISDIIILNNGNQKKIKVNKLILAVPPKPLYNIISSSLDIQNSFGNINKLKTWKSKNSYFDYIPLTFHYFSKDVKLPKLNGFPRTPWGIGFIIISDFMDFEGEPSKQCISICISMTDVPNELGKTANNSTMTEIIDHVKKQLSMFPTPDKVIVSPQVVRSGDKWINLDTAYVLTTDQKYLDYKSIYNNLFAVGIFNGNSTYNFTSMESAVQNAMFFCEKEMPDLKYKFKNRQLKEVKYYIYDFLLILLVIILIIIVKKIIPPKSN
jgi:hypothetical protein